MAISLIYSIILYLEIMFKIGKQLKEVAKYLHFSNIH